MSDVIERKIQEAINIVKKIPDPYHNIAFGVVLRHLLSSESNITTIRHHKPEFISTVSNDQAGLDIMLKSDYDWSTTNLPKLTALGQNLLLLKIAKDNFNIDDLSPSEIKTILYEKFRIIKTPNAISMLLMEVLGKYVDRVRKGNTYSYKITSQGRSQLENLLNRVKE